MPHIADLSEIETERARLAAEYEELSTKHGDDPAEWPTGVRVRADNLSRAIDRTEDQILAVQASRAERAEKIDALRTRALNPANLESGSPTAIPAARTRGTEHSRAARVVDENHRSGDISDAVAESITHLLEVPGGRSVDMAKWVEASGDTNYLTAFAKRLADPVAGHLNWTTAEAEAHRSASEYQRAALSLSGAASMLPLSLDPTIALTNTGSIGGIRSVCRHETTASNAWNGVTSAGATAEWKAEGAQAADGTPAVSGKTIPVQMLDIDALVSYEVEMDALNFASELGKVLFDSAAVAVDAALATGAGSGSNQPVGIITALTGSQDVLTAGAFASANVVALQNALPARFQPNAKFVTPLAVRNTIGSFETTAGALRFPGVDSGRLLNRDLVEDSNLATDMTTSGSKFAVYGDWNQFLMVTRTGASIEILPNYGANGRPTAQRHYFLTMRVGSDALVSNGFRVMRKS